jgi:hypothetical protein
MPTMMQAHREAARIVLDTTATEFVEPGSRNSSRLVRKWQRTTEGHLVCSWHQICPDEAGESNVLAESNPSGKDLSHQIHGVGRRTNMTQVHLRGLEIGAFDLPNLTGANDAQSPALPTSRVEVVIRWIAIAALLAVAGYETFLSFTLEPNGLL